MSGWPRDELVEARADAILAGVDTAEAYAEHFEAQMRPGPFEAQMYLDKARKLLAPLRVIRRKRVILLAVILAPIGLLGYAAATTDAAPVVINGANGVAAVNTTSGRLVAVTPLPGPPGAVTAAYGSVWVADPAAGQVSRIDPGTGAKIARVPVGGEPGTISRIDPRTDQVTATVSVTGAPASLTVTNGRLWTGVRQTAATTGGDPAVAPLAAPGAYVLAERTAAYGP